ncbi:hypothetical protein HHK36_018268 [Tetracentron sinense]|uniref:Uncharacterized protein n=1 Tax=Tetracentron sinense TaxID=13715 RepID=A0A834YVL9_TETSI|nr:hypothetical protein HHK36_018268 [Tetracentron sinense]
MLRNPNKMMITTRRTTEVPWFSTDWDKAWSSFRKQGKKTLFSQFNPGKYVSWNPRRSNYAVSKEFDPSGEQRGQPHFMDQYKVHSCWGHSYCCSASDLHNFSTSPSDFTQTLFPS